jgi:hypothetical protein
MTDHLVHYRNAKFFAKLKQEQIMKRTPANRDRLQYDLNAIANYAHDIRELMSDAPAGSTRDRAAMKATWILQAVKSALHNVNNIEE